MKKVLVVKAHPENSESRTLKVLNQFLKDYEDKNPEDVIQIDDLYDEDFPELGPDQFEAWSLMRNNDSLQKLSKDAKSKIDLYNQAIDQYIDADKIVIANPMWNMMVPTKLKSWIDAINIAGKTFKYTADGAEPLAPGKKVIHIQSAGGFYEGKDFGSQYIKGMMEFLGSQPVQKISVEGMDHFPEKAEGLMQESLSEARKLATTF
ncbi:FMN-dependent NADH-azoreductase [Companilactobacillus sp.]|jgi:FMN-dependent NADH-azoreductase|uniref:FMN-dependent NADH-azoreductase n=1 Tax=Companilactobacillus sp. TaxID=2767905 RepID=UPI0025BA607A|nr:NAD(P)H-dependent oxidoreductase [Companilactobacillus sp.]MCH4009410.1 NAD(P)H-dependent oxidoreductase [Companilactobacillus sp.]MCH4050411.1 NAD(P)H-dependent oxidoreductase [Companilactobacillus sp.]MCH4077352.1 NAD(P)H-dependent oxidoreductase [Companilactobacillus sp.]MCH4125928.1 NAD(P)H-dependent oxidoreductase [Companilactobacillus sp.]MCI1311637.1 NAD(P)H-dependent oxidoreductase [Companilactobacillus sp.]